MNINTFLLLSLFFFLIFIYCISPSEPRDVLIISPTVPIVENDQNQFESLDFNLLNEEPPRSTWGDNLLKGPATSNF